jgi:hypothetical protein
MGPVYRSTNTGWGYMLRYAHDRSPAPLLLPGSARRRVRPGHPGGRPGRPGLVAAPHVPVARQLGGRRPREGGGPSRPRTGRPRARGQPGRTDAGPRAHARACGEAADAGLPDRRRTGPHGAGLRRRAREADARDRGATRPGGLPAPAPASARRRLVDGPRQDSPGRVLPPVRRLLARWPRSHAGRRPGRRRPRRPASPAGPGRTRGGR